MSIRTLCSSVCFFCLIAACVPIVGIRAASVHAQEIAAAEMVPAEAQAAAVALNYSRASFHRIRRYPSKRVLLEEREQILNNLDLNGIADEETVRLYTAVLAEISDFQIAERERLLIRDQFQRQLERQIFFNAWSLTTQIASADYLNAVRTGASSWWDYRALTWQKDFDTWKVDKSQMVGVVDKSSLFLDTFWKLTRKRGIPDRWLIRGDDLDRLEAAVREPDPETRLRVLRRMESFMECYPPYWYYVARTQQSLGQLFAAAATYERMAQLGVGHFRRDEMLAAGLANRAMIQECLQQAGAPQTARDALRHATTVWEVNLASASVLERHGFHVEAEDAILRNLDVGLEKDQSRVAMAGFYARTGNRDKLRDFLKNGDAFPALPPVMLVEAALLLKEEAIGVGVAERLAGSMACYPDLKFGKDDLIVQAAAGWNIAGMQLALKSNHHRFEAGKSQATARGGHQEVRFQKVADLGTPLKPGTMPGVLHLTLAQAGRPTIVLQLHSTGLLADIANDVDRTWSPLPFGIGQRPPVYRITGAAMSDAAVSFQPDNAPATLSATSRP